MGRIFETRKATMFARWNKMAKVFTRVSKDIIMAVKAGGANPDSNPALRRAIQNARAANMPKDKVEGSIKKALGGDQADYTIVIYEGFGPHGVPIIVECATDNGTRTVANVRSAFKEYGGNMGTTGSVAHMFSKMGVFKLKREGLDLDALEFELIDHGLAEMGEGKGENGEDIVIARCAFTDFGTLQHAIEQKGLATISAEMAYVPAAMVELPEDQAKEVLELVDQLEQDDDVQNVFHNLG